MPKEGSGIALRFKNRIYIVPPDFSLAREIESELGGIMALQDSFLRGSWKVTDLVTLAQMMLQAAGETVDYAQLGNQMVKEGLGPYHAAVMTLLRRFLHAA